MRHAADRPGHPGPLGRAAPGGGAGRGDTGPGDGALADADLFAGAAHPIDGTRPTVNIGTMISGGITPSMHPEAMTATVEVRVIEGMTIEDVPNELRPALARAGLAGRVEIALAGPPHDWVPPSSAAGATRLIDSAAAAMRSVLGTEAAPGVLLGVTDSCC